MSNLEMCWGAFIRYDGWKQLADVKGKAFNSMADFCKTKRPQGLGRNPDEIDALLKEGAEKRTAQAKAADPDVKPLADPDTTNQHNKGVDNVNGRPTGNSAEY